MFLVEDGFPKSDLKIREPQSFIEQFNNLVQIFIECLLIFWPSLAESGYVTRESAPQIDVCFVLVLIIKDQQIVHKGKT